MRGGTPNNAYSVALAVPPLRPNSTAALFLQSSAVASSISPRRNPHHRNGVRDERGVALAALAMPAAF